MTQAARRLATTTALVIAGTVFLATDSHKHLIATVWPLVEAFWFNYIAF